MEVNQESENSFIIPINNDFLVYFPLKGISALINLSGALELQKLMKMIPEKQENPESELFEFARDIRQSPNLTPLRVTGDLCPGFLGIIPTRSCNGACNYCDFAADKALEDKMSYKLAVKTIDWYVGLLKSYHRNEFEIHFFGGEPMIAKDVIEVIVHRARLLAMENDLIPFFEISTNGIYKTADAKFLGQYFNKVVLSLDGFKEAHNRHRPLKGGKSSFEIANETAKIISNSNADLCIRCCISNENITKMEEFTEWLCQNFRLSAINFEILCSTSQTLLIGLLPPDPVEFAIHFQKSREIADNYGIKVVYASDITGQPVVSSCPVGKDTAIVSPDGRISNCYLLPERWKKVGLNLDFGFIDPDNGVLIDNSKIDQIRKMVENKPRCADCFCKWSCSGGCHVGITYPGCDLEYDDFCNQTRLISVFTLLSNLGFQNKIDELIRTPKALQKIINQPTDHIQKYIF
jgi:uncharacterized protein